MSQEMLDRSEAATRRQRREWEFHEDTGWVVCGMENIAQIAADAGDTDESSVACEYGRLIAAAPLLLKTLRQAHAVLQDIGYERPLRDGDPAEGVQAVEEGTGMNIIDICFEADRCQAAIDRATGKFETPK